MLSGEGNENGKKEKTNKQANKQTTVGLVSKKAALHMQHTFFVQFFAAVLHNCHVKLPETS